MHVSMSGLTTSPGFLSSFLLGHEWKREDKEAGEAAEAADAYFIRVLLTIDTAGTLVGEAEEEAWTVQWSSFRDCLLFQSP